jgi:hypothetical protein
VQIYRIVDNVADAQDLTRRLSSSAASKEQLKDERRPYWFENRDKYHIDFLHGAIPAPRFVKSMTLL